MQSLFNLFLVLLLTVPIFSNAQYFDGSTLKEVELGTVSDRIQPGTIVVFGEVHGSEAHHQNQRDLLVKLTQRKSILALSVGMEFIDYTQQNYLDDFLNGKLNEENFLKAISWGSIGFENYRFQVKLPPYRQGWTYGINMPRQITGKVGRGGLESLDAEEKKLLPPNFEIGNESYYERFEEVMKGHVPDEALANYFTAQSLWDDTMAWQSMLAMEKKPTQTLAIIVGDFHAAWGHGLAARLKARGAQDVLVITQVQDMNQLALHPKYGPRGDFVFVSKEEKPQGHPLANLLAQ